MNQQHLVKFTIRQMERERERTLQLKKQHHQSMTIRLKNFVINCKAKISLKRGINHD